MDNRTVARKLLDWARSLEAEHASLYRVRAYRRAAETILGLDRPVEELVEGGGRKSLKELLDLGGSAAQLGLVVRISTTAIVFDSPSVTAPMVCGLPASNIAPGPVTNS